MYRTHYFYISSLRYTKTIGKLITKIIPINKIGTAFRNFVFNVCDLIMHPKINSNCDITRTINNINITDKNHINIMDVTMFSKLFI